jgi:hypothetical protein
LARKILLIVALAVTGAVVGAANVGAQLGGGNVQLPGGGSAGSGGVNLPGGGGVHLPGGGGGGGVDLPGGGGVQLPGGGGGGSVELPGGGGTVPLPGGSPTPPPPESPPPTGGGGHYGGAASGGSTGGRGGGHNGGGSGGGGGAHGSNGGGGSRWQPPSEPIRQPNGVPTQANPTLTVADIGPAPIGVPNFVIDQFEIPPFLLPIYQACGTQYGIPWEVLAGINKIETGFGTNLNVSTAGAIGWMQFIPSTWQMYGVDATGDGRKDPYNPVDAICAAARYLKAAGGDKDIRQGIFAYNHASWYVDEVMLAAKQYGNIPSDLVDSLTGLTAGDRFPVAADSRYADDIAERPGTQLTSDGGASTVGAPPAAAARGINIYSRARAPVVAVNDGTVKRIGHDAKHGNFLVLEDTYGNRFTYSDLGAVSRVYPASKQRHPKGKDLKLVQPGHDSPPTAPATRGGKKETLPSDSSPQAKGSAAGKSSSKAGPKHDAAPAETGSAGAPAELQNTQGSDRRLFAFPNRSGDARRGDLTGQLDPPSELTGFSTFNPLVGEVKSLQKRSLSVRPLREGSRVTAGTVLGRLGEGGSVAPHLNFSIRPVGKGAPAIDPKPILDGWKLLEATAIYRAQNKNPFGQAGSSNVTQDLLLSKTQIEHKVLDDPRLSIYECGREDIQTGQIDQRVLAAMEYLADNGFDLTITSLKCGHGLMTTSGNISEHSTGDAMDIAVVNGIPIAGHQGPGSITESVIQTLLRLQGPMEPHQIISLMTLGGPSFAMSDHWDHIHVGYMPDASASTASKSQQLSALLKPKQWRELVGRISQIQNPHVRSSASQFAVRAHAPQGKHRASHSHVGD